MAGLPRSIIKKYGVSKKAWTVFRGGKTTRRKSRSSSGGTMARKRYSRRRGGGGFGMGGVKGLLGAAAVGVGAGALLSMVAPSLGQNPLVKHGAAFALGGPVGAIASVVLSGGLGNLFGGMGGRSNGEIF